MSCDQPQIQFLVCCSVDVIMFILTLTRMPFLLKPFDLSLDLGDHLFTQSSLGLLHKDMYIYIYMCYSYDLGLVQHNGHNLHEIGHKPPSYRHQRYAEYLLPLNEAVVLRFVFDPCASFLHLPFVPDTLHVCHSK